jgi:hypothetical protein
MPDWVLDKKAAGLYRSFAMTNDWTTPAGWRENWMTPGLPAGKLPRTGLFQH